MYKGVNPGEHRDKDRNDKSVYFTCVARECQRTGDWGSLAELERKLIQNWGSIHETHTRGLATHHLESWGMAFMRVKLRSLPMYTGMPQRYCRFSSPPQWQQSKL